MKKENIYFSINQQQRKRTKTTWQDKFKIIGHSEIKYVNYLNNTNEVSSLHSITYFSLKKEIGCILSYKKKPKLILKWWTTILRIDKAEFKSIKWNKQYEYWTEM